VISVKNVKQDNIYRILS